MAITHVNTTNANSNSQTAATPAEPATAAEDDLILAGAVHDDDTLATWTDPADFTEIDQFLETDGNDASLYVGRKVRGATAGNGYTFSHDQPAGPTAASLACFRGVDTTTPLDVTYAQGSHYNSSIDAPNTAAPAITTVTDGAAVVLIQMLSNTISGDPGPPSGYTEIGAFCGNGLQSNRGMYVCFRIIATAGVETPGAFTHTDVTGTSDTRCFTIALRPAPGVSIPVATHHRKTFGVS